MPILVLSSSHEISIMPKPPQQVNGHDLPFLQMRKAGPGEKELSQLDPQLQSGMPVFETNYL